MNKKKFCCISVVTILVGALAPGPVSALDLEVAYTTDDNVTRSGYKYSDSIVSAALGSSYRVATGEKSQLVWRWQGGLDKYSSYEKLSRAFAGVNGAWQFRPSGDFSAPTYSLLLGATYEAYDSKLRGGTMLQIGGSVLKPVTDRISVTGIVEMRKRDASSSVFDTSDTSTRINLDYLVSNRVTMYVTYNRLTGDMVIMAPWAAPYNTYPYKAWTYDDAFGGSWAAYLLDATTDVGTLGFNFKLNEKSSVDASILSASSTAYGGVSYTDTRLSVAYLRRF